MPEDTYAFKLAFFRPKGKTSGLINKAFVHQWVENSLKEGSPWQCILLRYFMFLLAAMGGVSLKTETVLPP